MLRNLHYCLWKVKIKPSLPFSNLWCVLWFQRQSFWRLFGFTVSNSESAFCLSVTSENLIANCSFNCCQVLFGFALMHLWINLLTASPVSWYVIIFFLASGIIEPAHDKASIRSVRPAKTQIKDASTQSDQGLRWSHVPSKAPGYPKRDTWEPLKYCVDVQTDLSLCWLQWSRSL